MGVLAIDGPGQNEALISRGIRVTESNFIDAGRAAMDYLISRPEIDAARIGIAGISTKAVDRFGRKRHQATVVQQACSARHLGRI
jgi:hypothetical protein